MNFDLHVEYINPRTDRRKTKQSSNLSLSVSYFVEESGVTLASLRAWRKEYFTKRQYRTPLSHVPASIRNSAQPHWSIMPPKKRGTRTRGHPQEKERGRETAVDKTPLVGSQSSQETTSPSTGPVVSVRRIRIRTETAPARSSASKGDEASKEKLEKAAKGRSKAKGKKKEGGKTREVKMASTVAGRKRRQKAATTSTGVYCVGSVVRQWS